MSAPQNAFVHPDGSNKAAVKETFTHAISLLLDFLTSANRRPVLPVDLHTASFRFQLPQLPLDKAGLNQELERVLQHSMNPANTSYIGHMDSLPTVYAIMGSLFAAALNNNMFSLEMSPYFTRMEHALVKQFALLFGLPGTSSGVVVSGGSLSNIQAIVTARNHFLNSQAGDLSKSARPLVLFASEHAHVSLKKAAMISGVGMDSLIFVKADQHGKMDVADLQTKIRDARNAGKEPFAVVATLGTTVTGSIDPIGQIAAVCASERIWLHADAVYGGALILSQKEKHRLKGIEKADSIAFNPQKWMHVSKTCALLLFRDSEILDRFFRIKASYTKAQDDFVNLSERSMQGTKQAEVLKLWLSILSIGMAGYEKMIDDSYAITEMFVQTLKGIPQVEFASIPEMNIPTFRLKAREEQETDALNEAFNVYALKEHNIFFSLPTYRGHLWQRAILLNPFIDKRIIDKVRCAIEEFMCITPVRR